MLITSKLWDSIRDLFCEAEKLELRQAIVTQTICPLGSSVDLTQLTEPLKTKLVQIVRNHEKGKSY